MSRFSSDPERGQGAVRARTWTVVMSSTVPRPAKPGRPSLGAGCWLVFCLGWVVLGDYVRGLPLGARPSLTLRVTMLRPCVVDSSAARKAGPSLADASGYDGELRVTIFERGEVCRAARRSCRIER